MVGIRFATMDFPVPALPHIKRPCLPAAATSAARRKTLWPQISLKSKGYSGLNVRLFIVSGTSWTISSKLFSDNTSCKWRRDLIPMICIPSTKAPSAIFDIGKRHLRKPICFAADTRTNTPLTGFTLPSSPSSPIKRESFNFSADNSSKAPKTAAAMGRSKAVPSFLLPAGDKLTVIFLAGSRKSEFFRAVLTRS